MERRRTRPRDASSAESSSSSRLERRRRIEVKIEDDGDEVPTWAAPSTPAPTIQPVAPPPRANLNAQQLMVLHLVGQGENVLYTGPAGSGKSVLTEAIKATLHDEGKHVDILAPTGIAALSVGGRTIHSYAGWTPADDKKSVRQLEARAEGRCTKERLRRTDVLIIDEISMVENERLEKLHYVLVAARGNDRPFGGVQLIVAGDFRQLGPVKPWEHCMWCGHARDKDEENAEYQCTNDDCISDGAVVKEHEKWAFHSEQFLQAQFKYVLLTTVYRQDDDELKRILYRLWLGKMLKTADESLLSNHPTNMRMPVKLRPRRNEVAEINRNELARLPGRIVKYRAKDHFDWKPHHRNLERKGERSADGQIIALQDHRYETLLKLKVGASVLLLINLDIENGLVNGSRGTIIRFDGHDEADLPRPRVRRNGRNNSNNDLEERAVADFIPTSANGYSKIRHEQILGFIAIAEEIVWPVVKFDNGVIRTIVTDCSVAELGDDEPYSLLLRTQIPLHLSYAITIHKSQGMTLSEVEVDLAQAFEPGQEYVALSRAKSLRGLRVLGLGKGRACGSRDEEVQNWLYDTFEELRADLDAD